MENMTVRECIKLREKCRADRQQCVFWTWGKLITLLVIFGGFVISTIIADTQSLSDRERNAQDIAKLDQQWVAVTMQLNRIEKAVLTLTIKDEQAHKGTR